MAGMGDKVVVQNFIGGRFVDSDSYLDSYDPSRGEVWARIPDSDSRQVNEAVEAARGAFPKWSAVPREERSKIMMKVADILESRLEEFAVAESRDQGKPVSLARAVDIPRAVLNLRFFATAILHHFDISSYLDGARAVNYTMRTPVGVAGQICPWNLPLYLLTFKVAPAIATGNTVVVKPSELTSVTAWMLCAIFNEAGLPPGVVNMVFGTGPKVGEPLSRHPDVPVISFTGSTAVGAKIREACAPFTKKLSLELGGKNAAVIFEDCDLEKCVQTTVRSSFANQGEICLCSSRLFVQRPIFNTFVEKFVEGTRKLRVGDPQVEGTDMGALVSEQHLTKVRGFLQAAEEEGATLWNSPLLNPLPSDLSKGYFFTPTVVTGVSDTSRLMTEEIFGPIVCIVPFDKEDEVVERANSVKYGLSATVWSKDSGKLQRVARQIHAGTVWCNNWMVRDLNMPFGGTKESGVGREGFHHSIDFYTDVKTVCMQL